MKETFKQLAQFETFRRLGAYEVGNLTSSTPSCFNDRVSVKRYRVIIEEIVEPKEVLFERIRKLFKETDNHHDWGPLRHAAKELGYELNHDIGH